MTTVYTLSDKMSSWHYWHCQRLTMLLQLIPHWQCVISSQKILIMSDDFIDPKCLINDFWKLFMVFQKHFNLKNRKWSLSGGFNSVSKYFRTHHVQMRAFSYFTFRSGKTFHLHLAFVQPWRIWKNDSTKMCRGMKLLLSINKNKQEQPAGCNFSKTGVYPLFGLVYYVLQAATSSSTWIWSPDDWYLQCPI